MRAIIAIAVTVTLIACSGGAAKSVLHMPSGTMSESEYRDAQRARLLSEGSQAITECALLRGLSGEEAFKAMTNAPAGTLIDTLKRDAEARPNSQLTKAELEQRLSDLGTAQVLVSELATMEKIPDAARAGAIIQEECARISP